MVPRGGIEPPTLRFSVRLDHLPNHFRPAQTNHQIIEFTFERVIGPSQTADFRFVQAHAICSPWSTQLRAFGSQILSRGEWPLHSRHPPRPGPPGSHPHPASQPPIAEVRIALLAWFEPWLKVLYREKMKSRYIPS
jgi:hypothetical protein